MSKKECNFFDILPFVLIAFAFGGMLSAFVFEDNDIEYIDNLGSYICDLRFNASLEYFEEGTLKCYNPQEAITTIKFVDPVYSRIKPFELK